MCVICTDCTMMPYISSSTYTLCWRELGIPWTKLVCSPWERWQTIPFSNSHRALPHIIENGLSWGDWNVLAWKDLLEAAAPKYPRSDRIKCTALQNSCTSPLTIDNMNLQTNYFSPWLPVFERARLTFLNSNKKTFKWEETRLKQFLFCRQY